MNEVSKLFFGYWLFFVLFSVPMIQACFSVDVWALGKPIHGSQCFTVSFLGTFALHCLCVWDHCHDEKRSQSDAFQMELRDVSKPVSTFMCSSLHQFWHCVSSTVFSTLYLVDGCRHSLLYVSPDFFTVLEWFGIPQMPSLLPFLKNFLFKVTLKLRSFIMRPQWRVAGAPEGSDLSIGVFVAIFCP